MSIENSPEIVESGRINPSDDNPIKKCFRDRCLNVNRVAKKMQMSPQGLYKIVNGETKIRVDHAALLCRELNCKIEDLVPDFYAE